ncbi:MAG TPA: flagellar basal-body MS-ring/collar protein FliF [Polyangia bacterium]|nr:flagellar basal-body MS-ring/collar protein FliF [Polyangia bacterium]
MEALLAPLRQMQARFARLPAGLRMAIYAVGVVLGLVVVIAQFGNSAGHYEYAFTNMSAEDSAEAAAQLKTAKIPFRMEAGGTALSVPATQVYDARLLLAASGLPRGGGVGFEIFDRGDLGVSDFTQRVNLRRATEGELGRTIGRLAAVRSARVHITLPEKGLYRDDDRKASAAVVLNLQPGRTMADKELSGVRHLVSSAVAGLNPDNVTVMDGRGSVLAGDSSADSKAATQQHEMEHALEQRISDLLEPAVGQGAVIAKVSAAFDNADVETTADSYDPDSAAVRSEHKTNEQTMQDSAAAAGVAGAAANVPGAGVPGGGGANKGSSLREDETRNFEISKTITHTVSRGPRLKRLSVAVLLETPAGKPRPEAEVARLADLAKSAVGFDAKRGDQFQISSSAFTKPPAGEEVPREPLWAQPRIMRLAQLAGGFLLLLLVAVAVLKMKGRGAPLAGTYSAAALLKPGAKIAEIEAAMAANGGSLSGSPAAVGLPAKGDPNAQVRDRARELAAVDPQRAAHLLRAWINADNDEAKRA